MIDSSGSAKTPALLGISSDETAVAPLPVTGAVLAGGRSRRMGIDKARVLVDGESLILRAVSALAEVCETVLVAARDARAFDDLELPGHVRVVADETAFEGPLRGVVTALAAAETDWVFVAAVDMPFLKPAVVRALWAALQGAGSEARIVMPSGEAGREPLLALYHRDCVEAARDALAAGGRRVTDLCSRVPVLDVPVESLRAVDPALDSLLNVNTPADLAEARGAARRGRRSAG